VCEDFLPKIQNNEKFTDKIKILNTYNLFCQTFVADCLKILQRSAPLNLFDPRQRRLRQQKKFEVAGSL